MPESKRQNESLIVILIIGVIALNYPFLTLFSKVKLVFGLPVLYLYLFTVWFIFIGCVAAILERRSSQKVKTDLPKSKKSE